ncbi:hypothetical protein [Nocardia sp. IFM 10818]
MTKKTAADLAEGLADTAREVCRRAAEEVRGEIAREIEDRFVGRPGMDRSVYASKHPDDCVTEELADNPALQKVPALQAALKRFDDEDGDGVSDDFRAGVLFAARLLADPDFDY